MAEFVVFAIALALASATPGPGVFALVARALASGSWSTLPMALGMMLGDLVYLLLAAYGLAAIAAELGELFLVIKWLGAAYLVYLGWRFWQGAGEAGEVPAAGDGKPPWRTVALGLALALGNPKIMLFYGALLPSIIDLQAFGVLDMAALCLVSVGVLGGVFGFYVGGAVRARRFLSSATARRGLNRGAGVVMVGAAGAVIAS